VTLLLLLIGCVNEAPHRIYAASSTRPVMDKLGLTKSSELGASSTLANQIAAGGPADLFLSANEHWADAAGAARAPVRLTVVARNQVEVVGEPLETASCVLVGDPLHVPAGWYARKALETTNQWTAIEPKIRPVENAPAAIRAFQAGICPTAISYHTDILAAGLQGRPLKEAEYPEYWLVQFHRSRKADRAWNLLTGKDGKAAFAAYGFLPP